MRSIKKSFCIILLAAIDIFSQSLSIGLGSGISAVQGDNYYTDNLGLAGLYFINGTRSEFTGLKFRNENDFSVNVKYAFEYFPLSLVTQIHYIPMRGKQSADIYSQAYFKTIQNEVTTKIDIWSFSIGPRYELEIKKLRPYITASLLLNYIGDTWLQFEYYNDLSMWRNNQNGMRYGLSLGFGVGYEAFSNIDFEIGANYNYMNLWNRRGANPEDKIHLSVEERMNTLNISLRVFYLIL